jgi:hypothetical protein
MRVAIINMLPTDVLLLIADYAADEMRLRVDVEWDDNLLCNPAAMNLIHAHIKKNGLSRETLKKLAQNPNPEVLQYITPQDLEPQRIIIIPDPPVLERWLEEIPLDETEYHHLMEDLCLSPHPQVLERVDLRYACSDSLSRNPQAIDILLEHPEHIRWEALAENPSERVMEVVLIHEASFLASRYRGPVFRRPDILEVDEEKKRDKVKFFISL